MNKITTPKLVLLLILSSMLAACSDGGDVSDAKDNASDAVKNTSIQETNDAITPSSQQDEIVNTTDDMNLLELKKKLAQVQLQAEEQGFVWSTTDGLIENANTEANKGNDSEAKKLFQEAILQYELSIEQAKYAEKNWKLFVPEDD